MKKHEKINKKCKCWWCENSDMFHDLKKSLTKEQEVFLEELALRAMTTEMDADYWKAKYKGEWPDGSQTEKTTTNA